MFQVLSSKFQDYKRGFTVFELLIVLGFIVVLSIVIIPSLSGRRNRIDLENTTRQISTLLREAQSRSMAQASSTSWGVRLENSTATTPFYALFATSYGATTTVGYYRLPNSIRYASPSIPIGGSLTIIFAQITGIPSTSTSLTLELAGGGGGVTSPDLTRSGSGKIFFDDFSRSSL